MRAFHKGHRFVLPNGDFLEMKYRAQTDCVWGGVGIVDRYLSTATFFEGFLEEISVADECEILIISNCVYIYFKFSI